MKKIITTQLARDIRASFSAQLDQLNNIEIELANLDFTQGDSDAQVVAIAIDTARVALARADDLLRQQVPDSKVFRQPHAAVALLMHLLRRLHGGAR